MILVIAVVISLVTAEIFFRVWYKARFKKPYKLVPKIPFNKIYFEPHPYLPYAYKKNFLCQKAIDATYPLNKDKGYMFPQLKTNNFRHLNGSRGDRNIETPKPKGLIRINCLGASTTGNYILHNGEAFSYPMELEKVLKNAFPDDNIEVNNCGQGGYTSAGILVKFLLDTINTQPDIVVIYYAYNDLQPSLTPDFQSDYSHAKKNLGEVYYLYRLASKIPEIPSALWNYAINKSAFSQNIRYTLLSAIARKKPDTKSDFKGLNAYERNVEHVINVCKGNNIRVVLSTFCHYLYPGIKDDQTHLKYREGVRQENEVIKKLASKHGLPLVESDRLVPAEDKHFVDSVHFTPEGMRLLAENISQPIIEYIKTKKGGSR